MATSLNTVPQGDINQFLVAANGLGFVTTDFKVFIPRESVVAVQRSVDGGQVAHEYLGNGHTGSGWLQRAIDDLRAERFGAP